MPKNLGFWRWHYLVMFGWQRDMTLQCRWSASSYSSIVWCRRLTWMHTAHHKITSLTRTPLASHDSWSALKFLEINPIRSSVPKKNTTHLEYGIRIHTHPVYPCEVLLWTKQGATCQSLPWICDSCEPKFNRNGSQSTPATTCCNGEPSWNHHGTI